jgi:hypothetical protein
MDLSKMTIKQIERKIEELKSLNLTNELLQDLRKLEIELSYRIYFN